MLAKMIPLTISIEVYNSDYGITYAEDSVAYPIAHLQKSDMILQNEFDKTLRALENSFGDNMGIGTWVPKR